MTNEELLHVLDEKVKNLEKSLDYKLDAILTQTKLTNGRVNDHDEDIQHLQLWKAEQRGQWKGITLVGAIIGAAVSAVINYFRQ